MKKYWRSIAISLTVVAVIFDFWDVFVTLPMALNIMIAFIGLGFAIVTVMLDFQDELVEKQSTLIKKQTHHIKAQQNYIDLALQAAVKAVYVNGNRKGFGRHKVDVQEIEDD